MNQDHAEANQEASRQLNVLSLWLLLCVAWLVLSLVTGQFAELGMALGPALALHSIIMIRKDVSALGKAINWAAKAAVAWLILLFVMIPNRELLFAERELLALWMLFFGIVLGVLFVLGTILYANAQGRVDDVIIASALRRGLQTDEQAARDREADHKLIGYIREQLARQHYAVARGWARALTHPDLRAAILEMIEQAEARHKKEIKP